MLQQRRIEILYHKFPEIFRGIIPEKYRYFSGKIPRKFPEISELTTLEVTQWKGQTWGQKDTETDRYDN